MDTMKQLLLLPISPAQLPQSPLSLFSSFVLRDHYHTRFVWCYVDHDCNLSSVVRCLKPTGDMILNPQRKMSLAAQGRDLSKSRFCALEDSSGPLGYRMLTRNPLKVFYQDLCFISGSNVREKIKYIWF